MVVEEADKKILKELARSVAEIAARPEQNKKRKLWEKHNDLVETPPLIFCDPELAWYEIFPATSFNARATSPAYGNSACVRRSTGRKL